MAAMWCTTGRRVPLRFVMAMRLRIIGSIVSLARLVGRFMFVLVLLILLILLILLVLILILVLVLLVLLLLRGFSALTQIQLLEQLIYFRCTFEPWNLGNEAKRRGSSR